MPRKAPEPAKTPKPKKPQNPAKVKARNARRYTPKAEIRLKTDIDGPAPMSVLDYRFCDAYVETGKQGAAYRAVNPDHKDPAHAAEAMMARAEIREHIKSIFRIISHERERAAKLSARSKLLTLEVADDRLMEVLETRRKTRGEMLTRDVRQLLVEGATPKLDENGKVTGYDLSDGLAKSLVEESAPVEDSDLLKAIDLTYKRKQGIVKPEKKAGVTFVSAMLYKPAWYQGGGQQQRTIEATNGTN